MATSNLDKMLEINNEQKKYYEFDTSQKFEHGGNFATKMWDNLREFQYKMTDDLNLNNPIFELHKEWLGDLSNKKSYGFWVPYGQ